MDAAGAFGAGRIFGVDLARGIALVGMFAAHIATAGGEHVYDGRSSILFATVAGVSLGLMTGGAAPSAPTRRARPRLSIAMRALALIALGLLLALLDPPLAVILDYYGLAFLLLLPLLFVRRGWLVGIAVVVAVAAPPLVRALVEGVPFEQVPLVLELPAIWLAYGSYPVLIWLAFPLAGLVAARSDLTRRRTQVIMIAAGAAAAAAGYGAAALVPGATAEAHSGSTLEVIASGGVALAVIGAAALVTGLGGGAGRVIRIALFPLAAAGGMALSLYTAHVILLTAVRSAVIDADGRWEYPEPLLALLIVGTLLVASLWRLVIGSGPLEKGLRELTRLSPARREAVADT